MTLVTTPVYSRILLKLSGEALAGEKGVGFDFDVLDRLAEEVKAVVAMGVGVGLVIGGDDVNAPGKKRAEVWFY